MALPNYSPSGTIRLGCVPWDTSYKHVRLYEGVDNQYNDIIQYMDISTNDYVYIGRNRRLKVSIHADRLYHVNYCMYQNPSIGSGWIYCFVTDVQYINDQTSELTIETDVFQTYLHNTDWTLPDCFVERITVPREDEKYLLAPEDDFQLVYKVTAQTDRWFSPEGIVIMSSEAAAKANGMIEAVMNPQGWMGTPVKPNVWKGVPNGAAMYYIPYNSSDLDTTREAIRNFFEGITKAGAIESVVSMFTVPDIEYSHASQYNHIVDITATGTPSWYSDTNAPGFMATDTNPNLPGRYQEIILAPAKGTTVDGYQPKNKKLLYWPYTYLMATDGAGSKYDYRYELFETLGGTGYDQPRIYLKYEVNPACEAMVVPSSYMGQDNILDYGFPIKVGAIGSWSNNQFQTWLAQHGTSLYIQGVTTAIGFAGAASMFAGARWAEGKAAEELAALKRVRTSSMNAAVHEGRFEGALAASESLGAKGGQLAGASMLSAANMAGQIADAAHQPTVAKGNTDFSLMFMTGMQGVHLCRMQVKSEIAEQIDTFFSAFGYAVNRVMHTNLHGRPKWDYVKTVGAAAKSYSNAPSSTGVPHTRGRGCPSDALAIINAALDSGCTFWHTTDHFGDYSQDNSIVW